jgi:hypothetical protein
VGFGTTLRPRPEPRVTPLPGAFNTALIIVPPGANVRMLLQ